MKNHHHAIFGALFLAFGASTEAYAQKWADLTMTVLLDGDIRKPVPVILAPGIIIQSEELLVDPTTKAIANVVFMIDSKKTKLITGQWHPDLQTLPADKPVLDTINCTIVPHVMAIRAGETLEVTNSDQTGHHLTFQFFNNNPPNPMMIPVGGKRDVATKVEEPGAIKVECSIYPWMSGYIFVAGHPYVGISDAAGKIKIEKLPAGIPLNFRLWHVSQDKSIEELSVEGKKETWKKGLVELTLKEGVNDLGTVLIKPDRFKSK